MSKFQKEVDNAIKWLATEHNYFLELITDLNLLKQELDNAKEQPNVSSIKSVLRDFRYIGKAEWRFNKYEHHVQVAIEKIKTKVSVSGSAEEVEKLLARLEVEAGDLIKNASLYDSKIKNYLVHLRDEIKDDEIEKAQAIIIEIDQAIEDTENWIAALSIDLKKAKSLSYKEFSGMSIEDIREHINHLSVKSKLDYLKTVLLRKKLLTKGTINSIVEYIFVICISPEYLKFAISIFKESKLNKEEIKCWRALGDMYFASGSKSQVHLIFECYLKSEISLSDWRNIGDRFLLIEGKYPNNAIKAYEKANYSKSEWNNLGDSLLDSNPHYAFQVYEKVSPTKKEWKFIGDKFFAKEHYHYASQAYEKANEIRLAVESAVKSNEKGGTYHIDPAPLYEKLKEWKLAGDYWSNRSPRASSSSSFREKAAIAYEKGKEWELAGKQWIIFGFREKEDFSNAFRCLSKIGLSKKKIWKMIGDYGLDKGEKIKSSHARDKMVRLNYLIKTAHAYEQAEEWDSAIKTYLAITAVPMRHPGLPQKARSRMDEYNIKQRDKYALNIAKIYLKTGQFKLAYEIYNRLGKGKDAQRAYKKAKAAKQL